MLSVKVSDGGTLRPPVSPTREKAGVEVVTMLREAHQEAVGYQGPRP